MFKIELNNLKPSQKNIIIAIILLIIVIALILVVVIPNDKTKNVASKNLENEEELEEIVLNEEIIEYADISELEQNVISEENTTQKEENKKDNTTNNKSNSNGTPYYIKINYGAQVVTIYKKDADGNYTVPVKAMVCSTGVDTPKSGVYKIQYRWKWLGLQGDVYGQYATQIVGNILFHSVPYLERGNPASLEYWEYDKLGTYASAGCIRLKVSDAIWIFNNCAKGTPVEFYSSSNPGPLGKPSAQKISNAEGNLKNWDPTDPDSNNPWRNYKPEGDKNTNTSTDKNDNQINKNEVDNNKTNTQVNETKNNEVSENITNNEIVNEVNTNTTQSNEIDTNETEIVNETINDKNTNTTKENEESKDNKDNEEKISTNIIV